MLFKISAVLIYLLIFELDYSLGKKKSPDNYFNLCHRNDPNLNDCIQQAITSGLPYLIKGIPEIKLPPIDPLYLETMNMTEGSGNLKLLIILRDVRIFGFKKAKAENFRIDLTREPDITIKVDLVLPSVAVTSKYLMDGKILILPVRGDGEVNVNSTSTRVKCTLKGEIKLNPRDSRKYLHIHTFNVHIDVKGGKIYFSNLFGGNKSLGRAINKFFNDRFLDIFDSLRHLPQRAFGYAFKDYVNIFFKSYPFDDLILLDQSD